MNNSIDSRRGDVLSPQKEGCGNEGSSSLSGLSVRCAEASDSSELAELLSVADGDVLSFVAQGINSPTDLLAIYRDMLAETTGMFSYRNCWVAEFDGKILGLANAFPAHLIKSEATKAELTAREKHLLPRTELNDPSSFLLNNIAVVPAYRRWGIGTELIDAVVAAASDQNLSSITLHVWADNTPAMAFCQKLGFEEHGHADIPWHPELPHAGGSLLFRLPIE